MGGPPRGSLQQKLAKRGLGYRRRPSPQRGTGRMPGAVPGILPIQVQLESGFPVFDPDSRGIRRTGSGNAHVVWCAGGRSLTSVFF